MVVRRHPLKNWARITAQRERLKEKQQRLREREMLREQAGGDGDADADGGDDEFDEGVIWKEKALYDLK